MFSERTLPEDVQRVRDRHAPDAIVLDCDRDFETLAPAQAEDLGLIVDSIDLKSYPAVWLPRDPLEDLIRYASEEFTIGMPGDGGVAWSTQTDPPIVLVKPRLAESRESFVSFLIAEALVQIGLDEPEHFLPFFGPSYPDLVEATQPPLEPAQTYQLAVACYEAYLGLQTRDIFAAWHQGFPDLFEAWIDAGERLEAGLDNVDAALNHGSEDFANAAELACSGIKHACEVPSPFDALDDEAYLEHDRKYALQWAQRIFDQ